MPQLNFNVLARQGPMGVMQGFEQGQQLRNQMLQQKQQEQLAELQMQNALREQRMAGEEEAAYKAAGSDMTRLQQELMSRGLGKQSMAVGAQIAKQQTDKMAMLKQQHDLVKTAAAQVMANPEAAAQILTSFGQRTGIDMSDDLAAIQALAGDPNKIKQWAAGIALEADKLLPQLNTRDIGGQVQDRRYNPVTGQIEIISTTAKTMTPDAIAADARARQQLAISQGQLGVAQAGLALRQQELAQQRDPEHQKRMAYAKATGEAIAKGDINAIQQLPKITDTVEKALTNIDAMIGKAPVKDPKTGKVIQPGTAPHPGFSDVVGATWKPGMRFVQGSNAANFDALYEQVMGEVAEQAYEAIRGAGAITKDETKFATAARTRMNKAQSEDEFVKAAREYQGYLRKGLERLQTRVQGAGGGAAPMSPATPGVIDFGSLR